MSIMTVSAAIERISRTYPDSPLAIFIEHDEINVVFANTAHTQMLIDKPSKSYIGSFSKVNNLEELKSNLKNLIKNYI